MSEYVLIGMEIIISIAVILITRYMVPFIRAMIPDDLYDEVMDIVMIAVKAAEQIMKDSGQGKIKKAQVLAFMSSWLKDNDIEISEDLLDKLIECAVYTLNQEKK